LFICPNPEHEKALEDVEIICGICTECHNRTIITPVLNENYEMIMSLCGDENFEINDILYVMYSPLVKLIAPKFDNDYFSTLKLPNITTPIIIRYIHTGSINIDSIEDLVTRTDVLIDTWKCSNTFQLPSLNKYCLKVALQLLPKLKDLNDIIKAVAENPLLESCKPILFKSINDNKDTITKNYLFQFPDLLVEYFNYENKKDLDIDFSGFELNLLVILSDLFREKDLTYDVSIEVNNNHIIYAHSYIIFISPYFRTAFSKWRETKKSHIEHEIDMPILAFEVLIQYLYLGKISNNSIHSLYLLYRLSVYGMEKNQHFLDMLKNSSQNILEFLSLQNCLEVFDAISEFGLYPDLEKIVFTYIEKNFENLILIENKELQYRARLVMLQIVVKDMSLSLIQEAAEQKLIDLELVKDVISSLKNKLKK